MNLIPHSRPCIGEEEVEAVARVVRSGMLAQGQEVELLEEESACREGLQFSCAVAHGTAGLHLSLLALGVGPGDKVLIPTYSCVSLLNPVVYCGAEPVLVDSLPGLPDIDLERCLSQATRSASIKAAIVPHMFGRHIDISPLATRIPVIEDCTHSFGCLAPLMGVTRVSSFFATKMLAAGEGGLIWSNCSNLDATFRDLRSYDEREEWRPRFNYKMTDMSAAILRIQLKKTSSFLNRRAAIASSYRKGLQNWLEPVEGETNYRFIVRMDHCVQSLLEALQAKGIGARRPVYKNIHRYLGLADGDFPEASRFWERALSLPIYPAMSDEEVQRVIDATTSVLVD